MAALALVGGVLVANADAATTAPPGASIKPVFRTPAAFDVSPSLRAMAAAASTSASEEEGDDIDMEEGKPERDVDVVDHGFSGDSAVQTTAGTAAIGPTLANFEGLSNQDNFNTFGFRVNPPDMSGDVGPNHYVEMINLVFAVFAKDGTKLLGPVDNGTLWAGFPIDECTEPSGDTVVLYDQFADRWILTQFTTRGIDFPNEPLNL